MKIIKLQPSPLKTKRYRVILEDNSKYDFGLKGGKTYLDGATDTARSAYRLRHIANETEHILIKNYIPSPSMFSYYLNWGSSRDIRENIKELNKML